jgi:aryl-alcohol dehydrogenase-like predicted oxidoreductase
MKTFTLGQSQLTASRLAYGCWRIATKGDAAADYAAAKAAIFAAVDAGYTLFDLRTSIATGQRSASSAGY